MNLYKDGQFIETWKQPRDIDKLREYLTKHAERSQVPDTAPPAADVLLEQPESDKEHNPTGKVIVLNEKNFEQTIKDGHVFVKYYAPWYVRFG
jgi:thioredoxin domain-containing protein 5